MRIIYISIFLLTFHCAGKGQSGVLDNYVVEGLKSNLMLQQKDANYRKSLEALREAKSHYYPSISLQARYTVAGGGRLIEFPVGDLLNPVYNTLNLLTASQAFPQIENESFQFYRPREHETKLQLVQPLYSPEIGYNVKIKRELAGMQKADLNTYRRQLVSDIKTSFYNYLKINSIENLLKETRLLLEENVRVNQKLLENEMVTLDALYRSEAELAMLEQQGASIQQQKHLAATYFNFLLNRPLNEPIVADSNLVFDIDMTEMISDTMGVREEIIQLNRALDATQYLVKLNRSGMYPKLLTAIDYGFQGTRYGFTRDDDFVLASLILRWDLFKGFQHQARTKQSILEAEAMEARLEALKYHIDIQLLDSRRKLEASAKSIVAAEKQLLGMAMAYRMVDKKYRQGQASLIEYIDARKNHTSAQENLIMARYDLLIALAEHERITATYHFNQYE